MKVILSAIITFVIAQQLFGMFHGQMGLTNSAFSKFYPEPSAVPLILLTFGQAIHLVGLLLVAVYLRHVPATQAVFPKLWMTDQDTAELDLIWQRVSAWAICWLPVIGFAWAWSEFPEGRAWLKADPAKVYGLFQNVPNCTLFTNWDTCRYGDLIAAQANDPDKNGSSFVPFWHPIIVMIPLSITVLTASALLFRDYRLRLARA